MASQLISRRVRPTSLVAAARARGLTVETIPGPSAITAALTVAGLSVDQFRFVGFLPRSGKRRREALQRIAEDSSTTVMFESPHRLAHTLEELAQLLPQERPIAVCRELTKLHEEVIEGRALEARSPGAGQDEAALDERIVELLASGVSTRDAAAQLAKETGLRRQEIYARIEAHKAKTRESDPPPDA